MPLGQSAQPGESLGESMLDEHRVHCTGARRQIQIERHSSSSPRRDTRRNLTTMRLSISSLSTLLVTLGAAATAQKAPIQARNRSDATSLEFKILQLADLHITGIPTVGCGRGVPAGMASQDCSEALTYAFVEQLLDLEAPDFIAFTGDNVQVYGPSSQQRAIDAVTKAAEERNIPYGMVFGNHDQEGEFPREKIVEMVSEKNHSYTVSGPETVDGIGNYMLNVTAPVAGAWGQEGDTVFRMYFLDSGADALTEKYPYVFSEYDWIKQSQIDYYRQLSETGRAERHSSADSVLPAVMFFHIPLVEFAYSDNGCNGEKNEWVHDQGMNLRLLSTLSEMNEVKATFVGHDHLNEYCCLVDGVQLCYGGGTGFGRSIHMKTYAVEALGGGVLLGAMVGGALFGRIADSRGRRRALVLAKLLSLVGLVLSIVARKGYELISARILAGVGLGGELPVAMILVHELTPKPMRGRMIALLEAFTGVGQVAGIVLAFTLGPQFGWRITYLAICCSISYIGLLCVLLPESPQWLASVGRAVDSEIMMDKLERAHRTQVVYDRVMMQEPSTQETEEPAVVETVKLSALDKPKNDLALRVLWSIMAMSSYALGVRAHINRSTGFQHVFELELHGLTRRRPDAWEHFGVGSTGQICFQERAGQLCHLRCVGISDADPLSVERSCCCRGNKHNFGAARCKLELCGRVHASKLCHRGSRSWGGQCLQLLSRPSIGAAAGGDVVTAGAGAVGGGDETLPCHRGAGGCRGRTGRRAAGCNRFDAGVGAETNAASHGGFAGGMNLKTNTLVLWTLWTVMAVSAYALGVYIPTLISLWGFNVFLSLNTMVLLGVAQAIGCVIASMMLDEHGCKPVLACFTTLAAVFAVLTSHAPWNGPFVAVGTCIVSGALAASWSCVLAYAPDNFATAVRGRGVGYAFGFSRLGDTIGFLLYPYMFNVWLMSVPAIAWIFAGLLVAVVVGVVLPYGQNCSTREDEDGLDLQTRCLFGHGAGDEAFPLVSSIDSQCKATLYNA
ncbi:unnamed protein product [Phytophthora lilii]|uniref:Unnamed protein product n=1 Tax=Phytophthora lilii TaxID=2077276 RepID=A0A9W6U6N9_9STRA|nr:unnamed protein product [Phytophthora lilii]